MPMAEINGAQIFYEDHGRGFPLVLAHGLGGDHTMWLNQVPVFKAKYRVVIWDCRGHGRSEVTEDGYSIEQFVDDQYALMRLLGIERAHIGGLSMGGWIAFSFAIAHPEATVSLLLSDAAGFLAGVSSQDLAEKRKLFETSAAIVEKHGRGPIVENTLALMFAPEFLKTQPEIVELIRQRILADPGLGYARAIRKMFPRYWEGDPGPVRERLAGISAPTLVIVGELDQLTPVPTQQALHRAIPGSRLEIIQGSGHVPPVEKPREWNRIALEFLDGIRV